jgi:hypothetical protein
LAAAGMTKAEINTLIRDGVLLEAPF